MVKFILLGILCLLALLLLLPATLWVRLRDGEWTLAAGTLFLRFQVYPPREKHAKKKKPKKRRAKEARRKAEGKGERRTPPPKKQSLLEQIHTVLEFLEPLPRPVKRIIRGIRLTDVQVRIRVAQPDAAATAICYGKTCAEVHTALAVLRNIFTVKVKTIEIEPDFLSETPAYAVSFAVKLHIYTAVAAAAGYLWAYLRHSIAQNKAAEKIQPSGHGGKV